MTARFRKKIRTQRGRGSGWGSKKKHRGGGSQGGKGMAGLMKHKKSWMIKNDPDHFGRVGFKIHYKKEIRAINLRDLDAIALKTNKKEINVSELGYDKVLSTGRVTQPLKIKARVIVESAKKKIEEAGGTCEAESNV